MTTNTTQKLGRENFILLTDSYKFGHWAMETPGTEAIYSYFESRNGAMWKDTVFFGLQRLIKEYLLGIVVTREDIEEAAELSAAHFGSNDRFNRNGWEHILNECGGKLPVVIKAVKEGTPISVGNVLMTVENLGGHETAFLTNDLETLLTHVWYSSTVATLSREVKKICAHYLSLTADSMAGLDFMLHDFGFRGVSSVESAGSGGMGHLVNFLGTDTVKAITDVVKYYSVNGFWDPNHRNHSKYAGIAYSVPATEHSTMTARGPDGECDIIGELIEEFPTGILSVVCDSYDDVRHVSKYLGEVHREAILARDGVFVVRPDSGNPEEVTLRLITILGEKFGFTVNGKGYRVLNPKVRILWGDGIDINGIRGILGMLTVNGWSAENMVFGMGGGLLQKVNRDTQRFAFKCSAQKRNGEWLDIYKEPKDRSKASKRGKLALVKVGTEYITVPGPRADDLLQIVFMNGRLVHEMNFAQIRENAKL
jgi:nicotinamide phosphoribosyltransferase